jgi:ferredoxin
MTTSRITIDPVACDAYGYCAEILPEVIGLDEWGYPIVDGRPLPAALVALAARAARDCPRRAITLTRKHGTDRAGLSASPVGNGDLRNGGAGDGDRSPTTAPGGDGR